MTTIEFNNHLLNLKPNLERFAYSLTLNKYDAEDLVQETYYKALVNRDQFINFSNLKAWTFTIMKNTFINNYRRSTRQNTTFDNSKDFYVLNSVTDDDNSSPDEQISHEYLSKAIENLEDEYKVPFIMHVNGYKYKEIADELNLKIGTVKSRIFFSRKKLIDSLKEYDS
jgi:RNA polymerase sigma-70 factor (ECF subfamily)